MWNRPRPLARAFFLGQVAQLVEHSAENRGVGGSIPPLAIAGEGSRMAPRECIEVRSSTGRAPVSKTGGWGFESLRACREGVLGRRVSAKCGGPGT